MSRTLENIAAPAVDYAEVARQALEADRCALVVVDIQEKLLPPIFQKEQLVRNAQLLIRAAGVLENSCAREHTIRQGVGRDGAGGRFPAAGNRGDRQESVLLFRQRSFLHAAQAFAGKPQYLITVRNGKSHLRNPDGVSGFARRLHCSRCFGCSQLAHGMELENRTGADARRGSGNFFDRDDDL